MENKYYRQTGLPEIGEKGQQKLREARVLVVGIGGLGSPVSLYLAGAGIGTLGIMDKDVVSRSNLHRQILYTENEAGLPKTECAAARLELLNPDVNVVAYDTLLTEENAEALIGQYDIVVDGTDNYRARYIVDETCQRLHKPYVYGAVRGFEGQVSVFHHGSAPHAYRELFPEEPPAPTDRSLVGMLPAVVGSVEVHEVLKIVCGYGQPLAGRLWTIDLRTMQSNLLEL